MMHRKFIALIVSAAIGVTAASAVPARADQQDTARAITGLAALAILGLAIHKARDKDDSPSVSSYTPPRDYAYQPRPRPVPHHAARHDLPGKCLRNHALHGGPRRLLGQQCLQTNYRHASQLPYACFVRFRGNDLTRAGYDPRCLRERGYRISLN
jgi:hypothetical protein